MLRGDKALTYPQVCRWVELLAESGQPNRARQSRSPQIVQTTSARASLVSTPTDSATLRSQSTDFIDLPLVVDEVEARLDTPGGGIRRLVAKPVEPLALPRDLRLRDGLPPARPDAPCARLLEMAQAYWRRIPFAPGARPLRWHQIHTGGICFTAASSWGFQP